MDSVKFSDVVKSLGSNVIRIVYQTRANRKDLEGPAETLELIGDEWLFNMKMVNGVPNLYVRID